MKTGEIIEVPVDELENFIEKNQGTIQVRTKKMGKPRSLPIMVN